MTFVVNPLGLDHDRTAFECGVEPLDRYIRTHASQDARRRIARVFVAAPENEPTSIAGYYTLSAGSLERSALPAMQAKRLPHYPVPVALIGRLAVDRRFAGQGLGSMLLVDAIDRIAFASHTLAVYAVVVDAKDDRARRFYERFGFVLLPESERRLFLALPGIR